MSKIEALKNIPDISFVGDKTIENIENEMIADYMAKYKEITGETAVLTAANPNRLIMQAAALQLSQIIQKIDFCARQNFLKYSEGKWLDNLGALKGLKRKPPASAITTVRFTMNSAREAAVGIPGGTRLVTGRGVYFYTSQYAEIPPGQNSADVSAIAAETGTAANGIAIGEVDTIVDPIPYVDSVSNITTSKGGAEIESDGDFTERIFLAPQGYSVAGPTEAYEYHARTFRADIADAFAYSPSPSNAVVLFMLDGGIKPGNEDISAMYEHLNDRAIRPMTDRLVVAAPDEVEYNIGLTYYINKSDTAQAVLIQNSVNAAIGEYKSWQRKIGRDINPSELIMRIRQAGAKRVELTAPAYAAVANNQIALLKAENVVYGGLEDD